MIDAGTEAVDVVGKLELSHEKDVMQGGGVQQTHAMTGIDHLIAPKVVEQTAIGL